MDAAGMSEPIDYFYSFRSPYSYLSAPRVFMLPMRFDVALRFRGVIPMAMRGQAVPRSKRLHTIRDVTREARRLGMPFGMIHDPIGDGALRCLHVAVHACDAGREREFVLAAGHAIWAAAVDVSTDDGLRPVCERAGLAWSDCAAAIEDPSIGARVEADTAALGGLGQWGVPVLTLRGEPFWGQDRIGDLEAALASAGVPRIRDAARYAYGLAAAARS
jgi:2-hydroxychromene-2-carboxylate isomerase